MATALGTQSSAATIPIDLECVKKMDVIEDVTDFVIPTCATIPLEGAIVRLVIVVVALGILYNMDISTQQFVTFIFMLSITAVAAPGIPGGVAMAATGLMYSTLGFDDEMIALMLAVSVSFEGISTATSVSGDGAVAIIVDAIDKRFKKTRKDESYPIAE